MKRPARSLVVLVGGLSLLVMVAAAGWYWWPRQVAPELTPQMVRVIDSFHFRTDVVGGGSRRDAHTLWARYHQRPALGTPPQPPRLLGISLAHVTSRRLPGGGGTYWVVYSDHVWSPSLGPGQQPDGFAREVDLIDPDSLNMVAGVVS